ncbi:MAG TPA: glycosyltransferase family 2 protein [Thermoanaerobaculia bacterium]|nr:glycosyltransferase family 2 protein [Thermoanaerobaculia bacterium]
MKKIAVALLSWNGRHHLETCLPALAAQKDPGVEWEILVLDNGSTDGTADWLRKTWPKVRLIASPVNLGFCAGNNRLAAEASDADALALLNNDTRPEPSWLAALVDALRSAPADVAAVSGKIVDWEGERLDFGRGVMTFDGHAFQLDFRRPLDRARVPKPGEELLFACGGNLLIRRSSFLEAGGFDESYFAYLEDVDLGWRLWSGGERILFAPDAVVRHRSSATSDLLGLFNRGFLFERNAFLTAYKNYEEELWQRIMPALMLTLTARTHWLLVGNNPGTGTLRVDPYDGWIANTGGNGVPAPPPRVPITPGNILLKLREHGPRKFMAKVTERLRAVRSTPPTAPDGPRLTDERTIAQLRSIHWLLGHLDGAAERRAAIQSRRRRSDREIFERFPLYVVPTYPGDEHLFASPGFEAWLPADLPLVRCKLEEVMDLTP